MKLALYLFGPPRLLRDGQAVDVPLKKAWALLAYLVVTGVPHGRDKLVLLLWPEADREEGRARLRRLLHRLRRVLDAPLLLAEGESLRIDPAAPVWVDVLAYRAQVRTALADDAEADLAALSQAAELCQADFLEGVTLADSEAFEEWRFFQVEDFRRAHARVLARLADALADAGDTGRAIDYASRALGLDPLDEAAHRRLMRIHARAGALDKVVAQYRQCEALLARELGVSPEPETSALLQAIRGGRADVDPRRGVPDIHYVRSGDVHIAYQVVGEGPRDIVMIPGFVSHLEKIWEEPGIAAFFRGISADARLILMDRRGVGLSDRVGYAPTLEHTAQDVLAVMDAVDARKPYVLAISEGGPSSILLAATRPERVQGLILWGTTAKATRADDYPIAMPREAFARWIDGLVKGWGGPSAIEAFAPSVAEDPAMRDWWAAMLRSGSSPGGIARILGVFMDVDVRDLLAKVAVPTLVLHRRQDRMFRLPTGRYLAEHIPGARFEEIPGSDHWIWSEQTEPVLRAIRQFTSR